MLFCIYPDSPTTSASSPCGHQDALPYECMLDAHCYVPGDSFDILPHPASISRIPSGYWSVRGHKRGYLADRVYHYDPLHYLMLSVPLPFSSETDASPAEPLLAVSIGLDMTAVADLVMAVDHHARTASDSPVGIVSTPLDDTLADTTARFLKVLFSPLEARVLGPGIMRKLIFRVLLGEQGGAIRAALA